MQSDHPLNGPFNLSEDRKTLTTLGFRGDEGGAASMPKVGAGTEACVLPGGLNVDRRGRDLTFSYSKGGRAHRETTLYHYDLANSRRLDHRKLFLWGGGMGGN